MVASGSSTKITLMSCTSAFTGTWYSAMLAFITRPKVWSRSVSSCKRHANAPHHAAHDLAVCGLGVQDATGRNCVDDARHADDAELLVYLDLGEDRRMCVVRL